MLDCGPWVSFYFPGTCLFSDQSNCFFLITSNLLKNCICLFIFIGAHFCKSEGSLQGLVLPSYAVGSWDATQHRKPFINLLPDQFSFSPARSSGWVPDGRGRWIKDENVEFDSDEEEPPDLPLD